MQKRLIINPTKAQTGTYTRLEPHKLKKALFDKVLGNGEFPLEIKSTHISRLIGNIQYKVKAINNFLGYEAQNRADAEKYLSKVADEIYGKGWDMIVLKNEVMFAKEKVFGLNCPTEEKVQQIRDVLGSVAEIELNPTKVSKATTNTTEGSTEKGNENE